MEKFRYNKAHYLMLLKKWKDQPDSLTANEKVEYNTYACQLDSQLDWETKDDYLILFENLMKNKINIFKFYVEFLERDELNLNVADSFKENLFAISVDEKAEKFGNYILDVRRLCDGYAPIFEDDISDEKKDLRTLPFEEDVLKIYLEIQEFLNDKP